MKLFGIAVLNDGIEYSLNGEEVFVNENVKTVIAPEQFLVLANKHGVANITGSSHLDDEECDWFIEFDNGETVNLCGLKKVQQWLADNA